MNALDYALLVVLGVFLVAGYRKGMLRQVLHLAGIALAFVLAARFHAPLAAHDVFRQVREQSESAALVAAFLGIFFVSAAAVSVLASAFAKKVVGGQLRAGDRWLGALFGGIKGVLLVGGAALGLYEWGFPQGVSLPAQAQQVGEGLVRTSVLVPHLSEGCLALVALIPPQGRDRIAAFVSERRKMLNLNAPSGAANTEKPSATASGVEAPAGAQLHLTNPGSGSTSSPADDVARDPIVDLATLRRLTLEGREAKVDLAPSTAGTAEGASAPVPAIAPAEEPEPEPESRN